MTFNQSCYALCGKNGVGENFVFLAAQHLVNRLQSLAHGSVFSTITRQTFDALTLAMAETSTMSVFEASVAGFFAKMKMNSRETLTLAATCDLLLPKLMSGEIRVKDAEKIVEAAR
jgi:type I restriction enzyme S subunit